VALGLVLALLVVAQRDVVQALYSPTLVASVSDATAGANADVTTKFNIPAGSLNFAAVVTFTPPEFTLYKDADVPDGTHVMDLSAGATLGLLNGPCNSALPVSFKMYDATTDTANTVDYSDATADADGNGLWDGIDKYPSMLNDLFPGLSPRSRSFSTTSVGGTPVVMQFVVFEPGVTLPDIGAVDPSLGYPSVAVLQNPLAPSAPSPITDFCTPLSTVPTSFGISKDNPNTAANEAGFVLSTNPSTAGDYTFTTITRGQRDADGDGIANGMDTCPFVANLSDPTKPSGPGTGDEDNDGIDDACDPDTTGAGATCPGGLTDCDGDLYLNRGDNCPLVANADNADADRDGIGDVCDTEGNGPNSPDGTEEEVTLTSVVSITGAPPAETATAAATATPAVTATATAAVTGTPTAVATKTPTATPKASPTATPKPSPTPAATATAAGLGGGGLVGEEGGGFPVWAIGLIVAAAVVLVGGVGAAVLMRGRRP